MSKYLRNNKIVVLLFTNVVTELMQNFPSFSSTNADSLILVFLHREVRIKQLEIQTHSRLSATPRRRRSDPPSGARDIHGRRKVSHPRDTTAVQGIVRPRLRRRIWRMMTTDLEDHPICIWGKHSNISNLNASF